MGKEDEYRRHAEEAERSAASATDERTRDAFLKIAAGWRELIATLERRRNRT
jgi:hypothetical protein